MLFSIFQQQLEFHIDKFYCKFSFTKPVLSFKRVFVSCWLSCSSYIYSQVYCSCVGQDFLSKEEALSRLSAELRAYVAQDNERLQQELSQWDMQANLTVSAGGSAVGPPIGSLQSSLGQPSDDRAPADIGMMDAQPRKYG